MPRRKRYSYPKRHPSVPGATYLWTDRDGLHIYDKRIQINIRPPAYWGIKCGCDDSGRLEKVAPAVKQYYPHRRLTPRRRKSGRWVNEWQGGELITCFSCEERHFVANPFQDGFDPKGPTDAR